MGLTMSILCFIILNMDKVNTELSQIIGNNISKLRKLKKLTQMEFANLLKYSDKAVSKWENGEATPNIETLFQIANFFNVTINDLISPEAKIEDVIETNKSKRINKLIIALLGVSVIWGISTFCYVYLQMFLNVNFWQIFIWSIPASAIVLLVFNCIWGKPLYTYILISIFIWTFITAFYLQFLQYDLYPLYFLGIPGQVVIILWSKLYSKNNKPKNIKQN